MRVPEQVGAHRVQSHGMRHLQPVSPILARYPGKVHLPATNLERPAIQQKIVRANDKRGLREHPRRAKSEQAGKHNHQNECNPAFHWRLSSWSRARAAFTTPNLGGCWNAMRG